MLSEQEINQLNKASATRTAAYLLLDWCGIFLCFFAYLYFQNALAFALCFVLMARNQFAVGVMMHEGSHFKLAADPLANDIWAQWIAGGPLFLSLSRYRRLHTIHHKHPLSRLDPNASIYKKYPMGKKAFLLELVKDLSGFTFFTIYLPELIADFDREKNRTLFLLSVLTPQLIILGALWATHYPSLYFSLYILPLATLYQFFLRMRAISEHAGRPYSKDQAAVSRSIVNPIQAFFFGPHGANYHLEHHLYERVQFYHLRRIHLKLLKENENIFLENFFASYFDVLREIVR